MTSENTQNDEQDIALVLEGNTEAFQQIVARYTPLLYSLAYRMIGDREEAEDAVQEIFIKAYRSLSSFDISRRFYSWIYTIAVNHLRSLNRKQSQMPSSNVSFDDTKDESVRQDKSADPPDMKAVRSEGEELAQKALNRLENKYREVFVLRVVEGMPGKEVAKVLDLPENTVKTYLRRARMKLIEEMKNFGWE